MAISLIEADDDLNGSLDQVSKDLREAVASRGSAQDEPRNEPEQRRKRVIEIDDEELPENLRGKDFRDVVNMLKESQSTIGRMANDLGSQRKLTDRLLDLKREHDLQSQHKPVEIPKVDSNELLENPTQAIDRIVQAHLNAHAGRTQAELQKIQSALDSQNFLRKHGDYETYAGNPEFVSWVQATQYRTSVAQRAMQGDYSAADELLSEFKERQAALNAAKAAKEERESEDPNLKAARKASTEGGNASASRAARGNKKIYRRADLLALQMQNPDLYYDESTQAELLLAYAEGRVK